MIKPSSKNLALLSEIAPIPQYDRAGLTAGIVHIGVGNFHRAHQAVYLDQLFNHGVDHDWAIIGAGIRPNDAKTRAQLQRQDYISTIIELDPKGYTAKITGSMIDYIEVSPRKIIDVLCQPEIRILSLTITEGGYFLDAASDGFDVDHAEIRNDIKNPKSPETVFGIIVAALGARRALGLAPFTIMSCDNLPNNGAVTREAVVGLAKAIQPELAQWIGRNVAFPNSMVDCITPATGRREQTIAAEHFAIDDTNVVVCEPFRQWVLEDNFSAGRPSLEKVGVEFVKDVGPYELMKLRILNGGHAAIAYAGALFGLEFADEAMNHPLINGFFNRLEVEEIIPTLVPIKGLDFHAYLAQTENRFTNAKIGDTIPRLCLDGSNRQPKFILPTITDRLATQQTVDGLALEVALWCRYCARTTADGAPIEIIDENADRLTAFALKARSDPKAFLSLLDIFGDLASNEVFTNAFARALNSLWTLGIHATLENYIKEGQDDDHLLRRSAH